MPAIFTFGATPTMPVPFEAAAIVPAVCVPWPLTSFPGRSGAGAPLEQSALFAASVVRSDVRVREVEPCVDVADDDGRAAAGDRVGLGRVDLAHVPLQARQVVGVCGRSVVRQRVPCIGACRAGRPRVAANPSDAAAPSILRVLRAGSWRKLAAVGARDRDPYLRRTLQTSVPPALLDRAPDRGRERRSACRERCRSAWRLRLRRTMSLRGPLPRRRRAQPQQAKANVYVPRVSPSVDELMARGPLCVPPHLSYPFGCKQARRCA